MAEELKHPPPGVETSPTSGDVVTLPEAARRLGMDRRTLRAAIVRGDIRGGARPHPQRLRWYVYTDQLQPSASRPPTPPPAATPASEVADLRAEVVALRETNLLLISAQADLEAAADAYRSAAHKYREALSLYLTPGHLAGLDTPS